MAKAIGGFLRLLLLLFLAARGCQSEDAHVGSAENYRDEAELVPRDELESDSYTPDDQTLWSPELFDWEDSDLKNDSLSSDNSTVDQHEEETSENNSSAQDLSNTINYSEDPAVEEFGCPSEQQPRSWQSNKDPQQSTCQSQVPQQSKCPHRVPHKHNCLSKASMTPDKLKHTSMQESKKLGMPGQNDHQSPERHQQERGYPPWWLQEPQLHEYLSKWTHPLAWLYNMAQELNQQGYPPVWPQETHRGCKTKVAPNQGCQSQTLPYQYFQNPVIPHQNFHPQAPPQEGFYSQESPHQGVHPRTSPHHGHWLHQLGGEQHHGHPRQPKAEKWQGPPHHHRQPQPGSRQGPPHHHRRPQVELRQAPPHHPHQPQTESKQGHPHHPHQPQVDPWQSFRPPISQGKQHLPQPSQQWAEPHYGQPPHQPELKPYGIHPGYRHWSRAEMHPLYQQAQENLQTHFPPDQPQPEPSYSHQPQLEHYGHPRLYHQPQTEFDQTHQLPPHGHPSYQPVEPHQFMSHVEQQYGHKADLPVPQSHGHLPEGQEVPTFTKKPRYLPKRPPLKVRWPVYKPSAQHH
ncbi:putative mediator of RNA polymerase II transcription subunit 26 isoform X1 [Oryzias melastigma]|uniref:putative mediator of RNA polymerase II transcription subunit 26 isoform X1 n=1 Tax=Oryzias melastigma TaxID=30732 RepID=UPI000CF8172F|nr:putative mediator of RNA polymerase II transcription subunit 26 isoform X1 [Oryzias melastigma]